MAARDIKRFHHYSPTWIQLFRFASVVLSWLGRLESCANWWALFNSQIKDKGYGDRAQRCWPWWEENDMCASMKPFDISKDTKIEVFIRGEASKNTSRHYPRVRHIPKGSDRYTAFVCLCRLFVQERYESLGPAAIAVRAWRLPSLFCKRNATNVCWEESPRSCSDL